MPVRMPDIVALPPDEPTTPAPTNARRVPWFDDRLGMSKIKRVVSADTGVSVMHIESPRRFIQYVRARQLVMFFAKELTGLSLPQIGRQLGNRDHTTILSGARKITKLIAADPEFAAHVDALRKTLVGE